MSRTQIQSIIDDVPLLYMSEDLYSVCDTLELIHSTLQNASDLDECVVYLFNHVQLHVLLQKYTQVYINSLALGMLNEQDLLTLCTVMYQLIEMMNRTCSVPTICLDDKRNPWYSAVKIYFNSAASHKDVTSATETLVRMIQKQKQKAYHYTVTRNSTETDTGTDLVHQTPEKTDLYVTPDTHSGSHTCLQSIGTDAPPSYDSIIHTLTVTGNTTREPVTPSNEKLVDIQNMDHSYCPDTNKSDSIDQGCKTLLSPVVTAPTIQNNTKIAYAEKLKSVLGTPTTVNSGVSDGDSPKTATANKVVSATGDRDNGVSMQKESNYPADTVRRVRVQTAVHLNLNTSAHTKLLSDQTLYDYIQTAMFADSVHMQTFSATDIVVLFGTAEKAQRVLNIHQSIVVENYL